MNLLRILEATILEPHSKFNRYLYGDAENRIPSLSELVIENNLGEQNTDSGEVIEIIEMGMSDFIRRYPANNAYRKKIWDDFVSWVKEICKYIHVEYDEDKLSENMPSPVMKDATIELIKCLHVYKGDEQKGCSKADIIEKLGFSIGERSVKDLINRLDANNQENTKNPPVVIAGQTIEIDIIHNDVYDKEEKRRNRFFSAKSTVNPLFLQLNVAQVYVLLVGLSKSYWENEKNMAIGIGMEIWSQLSEYTKERIEKVYLTEESDLYDNELKEFINTINEEISDATLHTYLTESDYIESREISLREEKELIQKMRM